MEENTKISYTRKELLDNAGVLDTSPEELSKLQRALASDRECAQKLEQYRDVTLHELNQRLAFGRDRNDHGGQKKMPSRRLLRRLITGTAKDMSIVTTAAVCRIQYLEAQERILGSLLRVSLVISCAVLASFSMVVLL